MEPDRELLIRDDDNALAAGCADLLLDPVRAARLGAAARLKVQALYDPARTAAALLQGMQASLRR